MKKLSISLIVLIVFSIVALSVAAASFVDVPEDAYYADAAERMADRGILSGYGDNYYYGNHSVTRAQIAALVCKMLGKTAEAAAMAGPTAFADVSETSWATGYVNYAVANGIISGDGDGNFRPDDNVKYEEVIKVIVCVLGLDKNVKIDPKDWSKEYIEAAHDANLTANLIGKKGEFMLRSDIAVICDAAMTVLDKASEAATAETTAETTEKNTSDKPSTQGGTTKPVVTTTVTTTTETSTTSTTPQEVPTEKEELPIGPDDGEWV